MGNSFGTLFRISTWGESHGGGIGVVIDGCPPRLPLSEEDIQFEPYSGSDVNMLAINDAYDAWEAWKPTNPSEKMLKNAIDNNEHL